MRQRAFQNLEVNPSGPAPSPGPLHMLMSDVKENKCNERVCLFFFIMEAFALDAQRGSFEELLSTGSGFCCM